MAAAQTVESRPGLSLLAVFVAAKAFALWGHDVPASVWTPFVFVWQDVFSALLFGIMARMIQRPATVWALYALIVLWVVVNVPVTLVLASPLTPRMMAAAGSALGDSMTSALTARVIGAVATVGVVALAAPWMARRMPRLDGPWTVVASVAVVATGVATEARIDTAGLHRNALGALVPMKLPADVGSGFRWTSMVRLKADTTGATDWRASPFDAAPAEDLTASRGRAAGFNVVLVALESTGARYLRPYGAPDDPAPNFSKLAADGVLFENAYAAYPESIKGLYGTLCARSPVFDTAAESYDRAPCESIAATLRTQGYHTALFHSGRFAYLGMASIVERRGFDVLADAGAVGGQVNSSFGVDEPSTVDRALRWIDSLPRGDRFLVTYLPIAGHHPYATFAPGPFAATTEARQYLNAIHEGDAALGRLLDGLRERHLDDHTLVIVFGDHGEAFGQHDGNAGHTLFAYDENIRVPYAIHMGRGDLFGARGVRIRRVVSSIDTTPTVLDLLGLPPSPLHQGVSMLEARPRMALFFTDYSLGWLGLRDGCWKYLYEIGSSRSRLFDVCADPDETLDRSRDHLERVEAYRRRVVQWSAAERTAFHAPEWSARLPFWHAIARLAPVPRAQSDGPRPHANQ